MTRENLTHMTTERKRLRFVHHAGLLVLQILIPCALAIGQPGGTDDLDSDPDNAAVPIDGGLSLLLAAGAAYGGRRLARKHSRTR